MTPTPDGPRPQERRPRRAVRQSGTVGHDDAVLVSRLPAFPTAAPTPAPTTEPGSVGEQTAAGGETGVPFRSADDSDVGWGRSDDSNDDRLQRDKPPHW